MANEKNALAPIEKETNVVLAKAKSIIVNNDSSAQAAVTFLKGIKELKSKVDEFFDPQVKSAHQTWKLLTDKKKEVLTPIVEAERVVKQKKTDYDLEQQRVANEARRKAEEEARKKEEKERKELERRLTKVKTEAKKEEIKEEIAELYVPPKQIDEPVKARGAVIQKDYIIIVEDAVKLLKAVIENRIPVVLNDLVTLKTGCLKTYIRQFGNVQIPGCKVEETLIQKI